MSVCIALRDDYDSIELRCLAKHSRDPRQVRRLLALAAVYDGMSRAEAAKVGGMDRQTLRVRPETLCRITEFSEHESNGRELDEGERVAVEVLPVLGQSAAAVEPGDGAFDHQRPAAAPQAGPAGDRGVQKNFPRTLAAHLAGLPKTKRVEIWFQDEARLGQKNGRVRIWAKKGTRPRLPADQRYTNAYLFGAICPMGAKGAALMLPFANTAAMQMHLEEISCNVAAKAHGVVLMDRAWWHSTDQLKVPKNLTIILLPSRSPELNPV